MKLESQHIANGIAVQCNCGVLVGPESRNGAVGNGKRIEMENCFNT